MSENKPLTKLSTLGEFGLIRHLTQDIKLKNTSSLKGVGDDAAVLDYKDKKVLVSTDMLIEGVHFDLAYAPLKHLGYKAVATNASDICAMNGTPRHRLPFPLAVSNRFLPGGRRRIVRGDLPRLRPLRGRPRGRRHDLFHKPACASASRLSGKPMKKTSFTVTPHEKMT